MKKVKPNEVRKLFNRISERLEIDADLCLYEDLDSDGHVLGKYFHNSNSYALQCSFSSKDTIFINTYLIHKHFNLYGGRHFVEKEIMYAPKTLILVIAMIIVHELSHVANKLRSSGNFDSFKDYVITLDKNNMLIGYNQGKHTREFLDEVHNKAFYDRYHENIEKCIDIILELERKAR